MGQWNNRLGVALTDYANSINNPTYNMSNRAYGALINAAYQKQAHEEAEKKRQLEVQKQKDADAALERKLKLQEMQYKIDSLNDAREQAKLVNTLAPWQPSHSFDSETGENVISGYSPLSPAFDALASVSGLNLAGGDYSKVLDDTAKAVAAESQDPGKYSQMTDKERQKAIDDVLAPYEFNYETRYMTPDVWKTIKNNDTRELLKQMQTEAQIYGANSRFQQSQERNASNERIAEGKNENKLRIEEKKGENQINKQNAINLGKKETEHIKGENKLRQIQLTNEIKSKLQKERINADLFKRIADNYLRVYDQISLDNPGMEAKTIRLETLKRLKNAYSPEQINSMCQGFKAISSEIKTEIIKKDVKQDSDKKELPGLINKMSY